MARTVDREIVGRGEQLDRLRAFLSAPAELPAALLLEGEAGIGKSTLWSSGVEEARYAGYRVLVCRPSLAEAALSYAALGDLLDDALDDARDRLSEPQRRALAVALLLDDSEGPQPDQRAVGVGVLGVLRALTASGRVLVAIDDVQWVDGATAAALDFALRRLREEPVAVLGARRAGLDGGLELADAERLAVDGLSLGATHQLLRSRLATSFPRPVLVRLHDTSGGNPFYALELGRALVRRERVSDPGEPAPLPDDLAGLLRERLVQLTPEALTIAAAVAALAIPTIDATVRTSDGGRGALEEAIAAEVLELDGDRVRFTHPLLATGAYNALWPPDRRALHARLATIVGDAEERARHLALAADGPDPHVAGALDEAARIAAARGARAGAAELMELAMRSTPDDDPTALRRRKLSAAELHLQTGNTAAARPLLEAVLAGADGVEGARALFRLAQTSTDESALDQLGQALELAAGDDRLAAEIKLERVAWLHALGGLDAARAEARSALESARRAGDRMLVAFAVVSCSFMDAMAGEPPDLDALAEAVQTEEDDLHWEGGGYPPSVVLGLCLMFADRLDEARECHEAAVERATVRENEFARHVALYHLAECECRAGRYHRAAEAAEQSLQSAEQMEHVEGAGAALYAHALADTYRGRVEQARASALRGLAIAEEVGDRPFAAQHRGGLGFLELSLGDAAAAAAILRPLWAEIAALGYREPSVFPVLPNAIDALLRVGERAEAAAQLEELERHGARLDSAWALAQAARCRGMLAAAEGDLDAAEAHFARALVEHDRLPSPFEHGRTLLALGATRRRAKRKGAARETLLAALAIFDELGTPLWATQAQAELASIGGRAASDGGLTATEQRVAELVADGLSTKQVAAALVVSPKTVEGHLSNIYAKLGIHSRTQLARLVTPEHQE